jgi:hypothetical protein
MARCESSEPRMLGEQISSQRKRSNDIVGDCNATTPTTTAQMVTDHAAPAQPMQSTTDRTACKPSEQATFECAATLTHPVHMSDTTGTMQAHPKNRSSHVHTTVRRGTCETALRFVATPAAPAMLTTPRAVCNDCH